jgi:hypothetical protein
MTRDEPVLSARLSARASARKSYRRPSHGWITDTRPTEQAEHTGRQRYRVGRVVASLPVVDARLAVEAEGDLVEVETIAANTVVGLQHPPLTRQRVDALSHRHLTRDMAPQ